MELFDAHCDTLSRCLAVGEGLWENTGHLDLQRTAGFFPYAQIFAIFADEDEVGEAGLRRSFRAQADFFRREMEKHRDKIVLCRSGEEITAAVQRHCCLWREANCWTVIRRSWRRRGA